PGAGSDEVEQDFKSNGGDAGQCFVHESPVGHEEAAHGVLQFAGDYATAEGAAEVAESNTAPGEPAHAAALDIPAADHQVQVLGLQSRDHSGDQRFVVL